MSQRTDRVDELLRQEIGALLAKELADPRIGFVTITDVETAPDLRHAKVWVSVIGGKADQKETLRALQHAMAFIRHELGRPLRIKRIPELHVHLDDTAERGTRVLHLLQELEEGKEPEAIAPYESRCRRPSSGCPTRATPSRRARRRPRPTDAATGARPEPRAGRRGVAGRAARGRPGGPPKTPRRAAKRRMTDAIDLAALARDAVPAPVLARLTRRPATRSS